MHLRSGILVVGAIALATVVACTTGGPVEESALAESADLPRAEPPSGIPAAPKNTSYEPYVDSAAFTAAYRRLTESQYRHTILDMFGPGVTINARFEPELREGGLQAIGNSRLSITTSGLEQYFSVARSIADQVLDNDQRNLAVGCTPKGEGAADRSCAESFIKGRGQQLFRRPLSQAEIDEQLSVWEAGANQSGDFYKGLKLSLISLLMSPEFLFRVEKAEADPANPGAFRLDGYAKAARLSAMLWDTAPDAQLLEAASSGELHTQTGLEAQIDRLSASTRLEDGARAFFTDMLQFETFDSLTKDPATYPKFSQAVADSAREETLKFMVEHLVTQGEDYRDIFTTRETLINRTLAAVYDVPYASAEAWTKFTFPETSERSGVLTQVSFLSMFSHPAASSPTVRGVKLHEIFLCLPTPQPPPDVDFSKVQALENGTVRTRLIDHMTNPGCSTCHGISDPAGLTLEHFDGLGQTRTLENGVPIDVSAEIGGSSFEGARGLGQYMHDSPLTPTCLVRNIHYYGVGRPFDYKDAAYLSNQSKAFAESGYRLFDLYRNILTDPEFYRVVAPEGVSPKVSAAAGSSKTSNSTGGGL